MTPTTPLTSTPQDAAFTEQVLSEWRDWRAFLQAQHTLLHARRRDQDDPFELSSADLDHEAAQQTINRLPAARRSLFQQVYSQRREEVAQELDATRRLHGQRGAADPDTVDEQTVRTLLDECAGRSTPDGRGLVPREDATYWGLDVADLLDAPPSGAYALKGTVTTRQKLLLVGGMLVLVLGGVGVLALLLLGGGGPITAGAEGLLVNGAAQTPIALHAIQVDGTGPRHLLTPVPLPTPFPPADSQAAARSDTVYPPLLCLAAGTLEEAQTVTLFGAGQQPQRTYTLRPAGATAGADLLLQPCAGAGAPRAGILQEVLPPVDHPVGATVPITLPTGGMVPVTVPAVTLVGPGHDLTLPADGARVLVTVQADQALDWPTLTPMLLLQTGAQVLPAETQPLETGGVQVRFLVAAPPSTLDAAFLLRSGDTVVRWRTTLEPPPPRTTVLRTGLRLTAVQATGGSITSGTVPITVSATLANTLAVPLTLTPADVLLEQEGTPLPLPELTSLREPLHPGEQRTLTLPLELPVPDTPLTLTIGAQRYTLTVTRPPEP